MYPENNPYVVIKEITKTDTEFSGSNSLLAHSWEICNKCKQGKDDLHKKHHDLTRETVVKNLTAYKKHFVGKSIDEIIKEISEDIDIYKSLIN